MALNLLDCNASSRLGARSKSDEHVFILGACVSAYKRRDVSAPFKSLTSINFKKKLFKRPDIASYGLERFSPTVGESLGHSGSPAPSGLKSPILAT